MSLKVQKTELVIFKQKKKIFYHEIKIKLNGKRLDPTPSLNIRPNALLFKIRNYVSQKVLRSIHFAIFFHVLTMPILNWTKNEVFH